jgi:hypothetical protein
MEAVPLYCTVLLSKMNLILKREKTTGQNFEKERQTSRTGPHKKSQIARQVLN